MKISIRLFIVLNILMAMVACNKKDDPIADEEASPAISIIKPDGTVSTETNKDTKQILKTIEENLGNGYKGYEFYANPKSVTQYKLFNLSEPSSYQIRSIDTTEARYASGESKSEIFSSLNLNLAASGNHNGFSGEITSDFGEKNLTNRANSFARLHKRIAKYKLTLADDIKLTKVAEDDLNNLEPTKLFDKYGTHYLKSIYIGASLAFSSHADRTITKNTTNFDASVKAAYMQKVEGSASVEVSNKDALEVVAHNSALDVIGGDIALQGVLESGTKDPEATYTNWSKTIKDNMQIADFSDGGLIPLFELVQNDERKNMLKKAWSSYMESHTDDVLKTAEPVVINKNSTIKIKSDDGRYIGNAPNKAGWSYYYPKMVATKSSAMPHVLAGGKGALETGNNIPIKTTEIFKPKFNKKKWQTRIYLGAFKDKKNLYYWSEYGAKTNWKIQKVVPASDKKIHFNDKVTIKNEHFEDRKAYLAPHKNGFLTSQKEPYYWYLEELE